METHTYLDAAGAVLPAREMMASICDELMSSHLGNPHSVGSRLGNSSLSRVEVARRLVLDHFSVLDSEYDVVFTSGATASMSLVGQALRWGDSGHVAYPMNSHTSLLGLRDYAPNSSCFPSDALHPNANCHPVDTSNSSKDAGQVDATAVNLLLVPGECNFSGMKADLLKAGHLSTLNQRELLMRTHATAVKRGVAQESNGSWLWLLDAAKMASSTDIDLSSLPAALRPHFVTISFYKIFGYPTGLGALLIRRDAAKYLSKRYHGGGTLLAAAADSAFSRAKDTHPHEYLEDGTPNFYAIAALRHCFEYLARIGGMSYVEKRTFDLTRYLASRMLQLRHENSCGKNVDLPLCTIFGRHAEEEVTSVMQGPLISFTLQWANGSPIGFSEVGSLAAELGIQLRTGCFCNVGGCQEALGLSAADVEYNYSIGRVCSDTGHDIVNGTHTGAVRVSLGHSNTFADCDVFLSFLRDNFLNKSPAVLSAPLLEGVPQDLSSLSLCGSDVDEMCLSTQIRVPRTPCATNGAGANAPATETDVTNSGQIGSSAVHLAAIFLYPIKSCAGMRVDAWPLCSTGLLHDRGWALVDGQGRAITQKAFPQLALVQPVINLADRTMLIRAPGMSEVLVISIDKHEDHVQPCSSADTAAQAGTVSVCGQVRMGRKISFDADQWFGQYLSAATGKTVPCTLLRCEYETAVREKPTTNANRNKAESSAAKGDKSNATDISFANTAQFLLLNLESVKALTQLILASNDAAKGSLNIKVENFRPNLLVVGAGAAHIEDAWSSLRFLPTDTSAMQGSAVEMSVTGPCSRCSMVNVDGSAGSMDCRAFQALSTYRKEGSSVYFGQFCSLTSGAVEAIEHASSANDGSVNDCIWLSVGCRVDAAAR